MIYYHFEGFEREYTLLRINEIQNAQQREKLQNEYISITEYIEADVNDLIFLATYHPESPTAKESFKSLADDIQELKKVHEELFRAFN